MRDWNISTIVLYVQSVFLQDADRCNTGEQSSVVMSSSESQAVRKQLQPHFIIHHASGAGYKTLCVIDGYVMNISILIRDQTSCCLCQFAPQDPYDNSASSSLSGLLRQFSWRRYVRRCIEEMAYYNFDGYGLLTAWSARMSSALVAHPSGTRADLRPS